MAQTSGLKPNAFVLALRDLERSAAYNCAVPGFRVEWEGADKPWGEREMLVATPDGHRIMVGQDI